jgi:metal-sulfur cluster biosynthetic enzyme
MSDAAPITEEQVREALRPVTDPEIGLSILDLGLVYGVSVDQEKKAVTVKMTLTSQMCPMGPEILAATEMAARRVPGVEKVKVDLVWEPRWDPRIHASEDGKAFLGIWS